MSASRSFCRLTNCTLAPLPTAPASLSMAATGRHHFQKPELPLQTRLLLIRSAQSREARYSPLGSAAQYEIDFAILSRCVSCRAGKPRTDTCTPHVAPKSLCHVDARNSRSPALSVLLVPSNDGANIRMAALFVTVCMAAIFKLS